MEAMASVPLQATFYIADGEIVKKEMLCVDAPGEILADFFQHAYERREEGNE